MWNKKLVMNLCSSKFKMRYSCLLIAEGAGVQEI